jgi:nucleoside-diphosphate-sugar epimerase
VRVILLGGAGYIGSVISTDLASRGHDVVIVDNLIYAPGGARPAAPAQTFVRGDFRDETLLRSVLPGADAVVHLGGLVGEPACAVDEDLTVDLNFAAPVLAGEAVAAMGVPRFVLLSTCSVYGRQEGLVTEDTAPNPLSSYAWTKLAAEHRLAEVLAGRSSLTVFRLATVFGLSPRMRLDSVVNSMTARAAALGEIPLRGGNAWRPLVYVGDVAECVRRTLESDLPTGADRALTLNVGNDDSNYTIAEIAETVVARVPGSRIQSDGAVTDHRDYQVSFARIAELMPGACGTSLTAGIDEIAAEVRRGRFSEPTALEYDNLRGLRVALDEGRVAALCNDTMRRLAKEYESRVMKQ